MIEERCYADREIQEVYLVRRDVDSGALTLQAGEVDDVALVPLDLFRERVVSRDGTLVSHWEELERVTALLASERER